MAKSNRFKRAEMIAEVAKRALAEKSRNHPLAGPAAPCTGQRYLKVAALPNKAGLEKLAVYLGVSVPWLRDNFFSKHGRIEFEVGEPTLVCAKCGAALQASPEGFVQDLPDGSELDGDGILRVWPCVSCCRGA